MLYINMTIIVSFQIVFIVYVILKKYCKQIDK